jgi:ubiquinone/menaquinone biosynthesis C-methylase UbiE
MAQFHDHFSSVAEQYANFRPSYPAALFDYLAATCPARQLAWDCACGSGQASLPLAERFESVLATDASAAQIAAATAHPRVRYRVARAEQSGLESASADLVTVAQALHWLELASFYAEVTRVLRPGGVLAVWTYGTPHSVAQPIESVLAQFLNEMIGPYWPPERALVDSGYRTLPFPFPEAAAPEFAIEQRWSLPHLLGYVRSWSATTRYVARHGVDPVIALEASLQAPWGEPQTTHLIRWPVSMRLGRRP